MTEFKYVGSELDLFATVRNWKLYWSQHIRPFVAGDILEVGAGMGSNTPFLDPGGRGRWLCLEPDPQLAAQITTNLNQTTRHRTYETVCGTLQGLDQGQQFDRLSSMFSNTSRIGRRLRRYLGRARFIDVKLGGHQRWIRRFESLLNLFPGQRPLGNSGIRAITSQQS